MIPQNSSKEKGKEREDMKYFKKNVFDWNNYKGCFKPKPPIDFVRPSGKSSSCD